MIDLRKAGSLFVLVLFAVSSLRAQDAPSDRLKVPFSDPGRPGVVVVNVPFSVIRVTGYDGAEVVAEAHLHTSSSDVERDDGLKRLAVAATGLYAEEDDNVMRIGVANRHRTVELDVRVPTSTSLHLKSQNGGTITVENVTGDHEVTNHNGSIEMHGISGSAVVNTWNGNIEVEMVGVSPDKPMSFTTYNGNVDVTFPADVKATLLLDPGRGDVYSDFDVALRPRSGDVKTTRDQDGTYRASTGSTMSGSIHGGGAEMRFKTYNGGIYIRKG